MENGHITIVEAHHAVNILENILGMPIKVSLITIWLKPTFCIGYKLLMDID